MPPPYATQQLAFGQNGVAAAHTGCGTCEYRSGIAARPSCSSGEYKWNGSGCNSSCSDATKYRDTCIHWTNYNIDPKSFYCPDIGAGTATNAQFDQNTQKITCTYGALPSDSKLFSDSQMVIFPGNATTGTVQQMRSDRCAQYNFTALKNDSTTCKVFYEAQGGNSYNKELFKRVVQEGPDWIFNQTKRDFVFTCITSGDTSLANDAANLFFERINGQNPSGRTYQGMTLTNPSDMKDSWGQYAEIVGFINQLLRTSTEAAGVVVPASIQTIAVATVRSYCSAHADHSACGCVNVTKDGVGNGANALLRCSTTDANLPGCSELKDLNDKFAGITSPNLAPFVDAVKHAFIPRCYSSMCKAVDTGGSQNILRPDVYQAAACAGDINVCISSISAGRDINADVDVRQSCGAATGQTLPSQLSTVTSQSGETVTAGMGGGSPSTTSGPTRQGCINGTCNQDGETFQESDLIIKPGTNDFVDKYLNTPKKQKGAIGGLIICIICCCCLILLMMMAGGEEVPSAPSTTNLNQARLAALLAKI
jgi:hypothetical protein